LLGRCDRGEQDRCRCCCSRGSRASLRTVETSDRPLRWWRLRLARRHVPGTTIAPFVHQVDAEDGQLADARAAIRSAGPPDCAH
jgi:hypothetical protein